MKTKTEWRLIDSGPCRAFFNMALDEAIATFARKGSFPPTLRLYGWDKPSVSLGQFQKISDVNTGYCRANDIPIVRRPTGGRAILHGDELTYSFSAKTDKGLFSEGLLDSYRKISGAFVLAFKRIGIQAESKKQREKGRILARSSICFKSSSFGEILIQNKKIVGSAQKRWIDGLLQQGALPFSYNKELMLKIFAEESSSSKKDYLAGLRELFPGLDEEKFKKTVSESFEETFGVRLVPSHPSQEESLLAEEFELRKYLPNASPHQQ